MSDPIVKAEYAAYKDFKQAPAEDGSVQQKRAKKAKPVRVEYRVKQGLDSLFGNEWALAGKYKDVETARKVIAQQERKTGYFEYRIKDE